jgi:hypothetical protein
MTFCSTGHLATYGLLFTLEMFLRYRIACAPSDGQRLLFTDVANVRHFTLQAPSVDKTRYTTHIQRIISVYLLLLVAKDSGMS